MIQGVHSIVLFCRDTAASLAWYQALGFELRRSHEAMHFLGFGATELMLHPSETGPSGAVPHVYIAVMDLDAFFARTRAAGIEPMHHQVQGRLEAPHVTPWGSREFELDDPDGHRWGFLQGRPA